MMIEPPLVGWLRTTRFLEGDNRAYRKKMQRLPIILSSADMFNLLNK